MILGEIQLHNEKWMALPFDGPNIIFSLEVFVRYLDERIVAQPANLFLQQSKQNIDQYFGQGDYRIPKDQLQNYEPVYKIVYQLLTAPTIDANQFYWGMALPLSPQVVYGTNALDRLIGEAADKQFVGTENFKMDCTLAETEVKKILIYAVLIKRLYNIQIFNTSAMVFKISKEHIEQYYQVEFNDQFIQVEFEGALPEINSTIVEMENLSKESTLAWLEQHLPLHKITFTGFSLLAIEEVTEKVQKEHLRTLLLASDLGIESQNEILKTLRQLSGCESLDILLLPMLQLNHQLVTNVWQNIQPKIQELLVKYHIEPQAFDDAVAQYANNPRLIVRGNMQQQKAQNTDVSVLSGSGIMDGLIIYPVFSKEKLVGIILIASKMQETISDMLLQHIGKFLPLLQNLFETINSNYLNALGKIIRTKFTSIQPSVEWKFNEVALQYLSDKFRERHPVLSPIRFDDIYPMYGAIDFRNSTLERNLAQANDWIVQLQYLENTISDLQKIVSIDLLNEWKFRAHHWIEILEKDKGVSNETGISLFLEKESLDMLQQLATTDARVGPIIQPYLEQAKPHGLFHKNSEALEKTFKSLNASIASILDQMNDKLQETYPCYFERYRTDGMEFNIYIGQSITPTKPFNKIYLRNVQLWQLTTMALIARITGSRQKEFPVEIQTTQLIFVHNHTISVSFRMDERRFDVEGSYNIRYEIIKKRIDKAFVKKTGERLTQPGKIAIVYAQKEDIEDYLIHINYLQKMDILAPNIEMLELEDMQGVFGLKALRIGVANKTLLEIGKSASLLETTAAS
ncbi:MULTISPECIES: hypothetical protein [Chitinophagaceae]